MWIIYALGSAFFAGLTAILAKCGIRETDSSVATAIRTIVVLIFSWIMAILSTPPFIYLVNKHQDMDIPHTFRYCYRRFLALLLPCTA